MDFATSAAATAGIGRAAGVAVTAWAGQLREAGDPGSLTRADSGAALDVTEADPAALTALFAGRPVRLRGLVPDRSGHAAALRRVRAIRDEVRGFHDQHGLDSGRLAVGIATWADPHGGTRRAPVLLRPLRLVARSPTEDDFELSLGAGYALNPTLVEEFSRDHGVAIDLPRVSELPADDVCEPVELYDRLRRGAACVPRLTVSHQLVLGTSTDAPRALAADLDGAGPALADHPVLAVLAGAAAAAEAVRGAPLSADLSGPDRIEPAEEFLALDADAAASSAIAAVLAGRDLAIEGGPGTGRTQTVANLAAALVAAGRTVLVLIANRQAAAELLSRLSGAGLAELAFDAAADPVGGRHRIAAAVTVAGHPASQAPDLSDLWRRLAEPRDRLARYAHTLHAQRPPWGVSVYDAQATLLGLPVEAASRVRFPHDVLAALHGDTLAEVREVVREWAALGGTTLTGLDTPWYGARVGTSADAVRAQRLAAELAEQTFPAARAALARVLTDAGLAVVDSVADWGAVLRLVSDVAQTERLLTAEVWQAPLPELIAATAAADTRPGSADRLGWQDRLAARRAARRLWQGGKPVGSELPDALTRAAAELAEWSRLASPRGESPDKPGAAARPRPVSGLAAAQKRYAELLDGLATLQLLLPDRDFIRLAPAVLDKTLHGLATDSVLRRLPRLGELAAYCSNLGLRPFLLDLHTRRLSADLAPLAFSYAWLSSVLAQVAATDPAYGGFDAAALRADLAAYRRADREHLASTPLRLRRRIRERTAAAIQAHPEQAAVVRAGTPSGPADGPAGLRRLLCDAPEVVLAAAPCWLMTPYAVPQLLPPGRLFDVVIVEEANTVSVPVAVAGLTRCARTVVVGDRRQLPPLPLRDTLGDRVPEGGVIDVDAEPTRRESSLLDALAPVLPRITLRSYRRCTDERLVAFAAATGYGGRLRSTPGPDRRDRLRYVPVPHRSGTPGQEDSVTAEVQKVVGLVLDHAVRCPEQSFGVVTLGPRHADRITAALRVALVGRPELGDLFRADAPERFFVKPCALLTGEVRDAVVFSVGLGKTPQGRPAYAFGPLGAEGGERLLTVGLTRARQRLTVVSSLVSTDLDPARLHRAGPRLLRALLRYAEVPELRRTCYAEAPPPDGLEVELRHRLRSAGLPVVTDYGLGAERISLALAAPDNPDRLVLAVSIDGPQWAATPTVRDRDRLAPEHLANLGWSPYRVLAPEFFRDPAGEVARIEAAYRAAVTQPRPDPAAP